MFWRRFLALQLSFVSEADLASIMRHIAFPVPARDPQDHNRTRPANGKSLSRHRCAGPLRTPRGLRFVIFVVGLRSFGVQHGGGYRGRANP